MRQQFCKDDRSTKVTVSQPSCRIRDVERELLLELDDVWKSYPSPSGRSSTVEALRGVTLRLSAGDFVAIHGPSGCGKSTLLLTAGAMLSPDRGRVTIDSTDPYALSPDARAALRAAKVGFVFQQFHLVPYLSVIDNVLAPSLATRRPGMLARAEELLNQFGLASRREHVPAKLSSGERQRCALARALLNQPSILLADEPTGNLDAENARCVLEALSHFALSGGAVLLVTHDDRASGYAKQKHVLQAGQLVT